MAWSHPTGPESDPQGRQGPALLTGHPGRFQIRGLDRRDAPLLAAHLLRLSPEDRRTRFHGALHDDAVTAYVDRIDWRRAYVFGAIVGTELRGVAELIVESDSRGEIAVSVEPDFRHDGLGRLLVIAAMLAARRLGLKQLLLTYQPGNTPMVTLARDLGARTERRHQAVEAVITLSPQPPTETGAPPAPQAPEYSPS